MYEICLKLTTKIPKRHHGVFIVDSKQRNEGWDLYVICYFNLMLESRLKHQVEITKQNHFQRSKKSGIYQFSSFITQNTQE